MRRDQEKNKKRCSGRREERLRMKIAQHTAAEWKSCLVFHVVFGRWADLLHPVIKNTYTSTTSELFLSFHSLLEIQITLSVLFFLRVMNNSFLSPLKRWKWNPGSSNFVSRLLIHSFCLCKLQFSLFPCIFWLIITFQTHFQSQSVRDDSVSTKNTLSQL